MHYGSFRYICRRLPDGSRDFPRVVQLLRGGSTPRQCEMRDVADLFGGVAVSQLDVQREACPDIPPVAPSVATVVQQGVSRMLS